MRNLPEIEGLSKETVLSSWMAKFDAIYRGDDDQKKTPARLAATAASELILSKDQLYEMFQTILGVKKYEHIILFNACQVFKLINYLHKHSSRLSISLIVFHSCFMDFLMILFSLTMLMSKLPASEENCNQGGKN